MKRAVAACVLVVSGGMLLASPAAAAERPLDTGLVDLHAFSDGNPLSYERARASGARFVRILLDWRHVERRPPAPLLSDPTNPADSMYRWNEIDREVTLATEQGLEPLLLVYGAPHRAERCTSPNRDHPCDPDPDRFGQFALAASRRYSGDFADLPRVTFWQAWNEPNLRYFLNPQYVGDELVAPDLYRALLNSFAAAVKSVHESNVVVSAGLAPIERPEATIAPLEFMRELLSERSRLDVWATNPYTAGGPTHHAPGPDDVSIGDLPEMRALLRAAEAAGQIETNLGPVPFWATEFSWDSSPPDPGGLPLWLHARWTAEALYRMWQGGISNVFWFQLRDELASSQPFGGVYESGLYLSGETMEGDRPKPTLRAFRFPFVAFRAKRGLRVWGRTPTSGPGRVLIEVRQAKRWRTVRKVVADDYGIFQAQLVTRLRRGKARARFQGSRSVPFALRHVPDRRVKPFGDR